jgi:L-2-hydroxyglutarate oxidase LhgO
LNPANLQAFNERSIAAQLAEKSNREVGYKQMSKLALSVMTSENECRRLKTQLQALEKEQVTQKEQLQQTAVSYCLL